MADCTQVSNECINHRDYIIGVSRLLDQNATFAPNGMTAKRSIPALKKLGSKYRQKQEVWVSTMMVLEKTRRL